MSYHVNQNGLKLMEIIKKCFESLTDIKIGERCFVVSVEFCFLYETHEKYWQIRRNIFTIS